MSVSSELKTILVPQGYPGGMDVMAVTEIRDFREDWTSGTSRTARNNGENWCPGPELKKGECGDGASSLLFIRTGKNVHGMI